eukprot:4187463-Pleurochrysis_carterae.AAC.1
MALKSLQSAVQGKTASHAHEHGQGTRGSVVDRCEYGRVQCAHMQATASSREGRKGSEGKGTEVANDERRSSVWWRGWP